MTGSGCPVACCSSGLLSWKKPMATGAALLACNLAYFYVVFGGSSFLGLACWLKLAALGLGLVYRFTEKTPEGQWVFISKEMVESHIMCAYHSINDYLSWGRDIALWVNPMESGKWAAILWVGTKVFPLFNVSFLVFLGIWGLFLHSFIATAFNTKVAPQLMPHLEMAKGIAKESWAKIPRYDAVKEA
eukprot:GDKI01040495.1.p2 GENE.GDKI01040495.1~~GDKI01040495.1.p2  ORF type:complete len:188 (-),score=73.86 GDKI01040495.1:353-916(-)